MRAGRRALAPERLNPRKKEGNSCWLVWVGAVGDQIIG